MATIVGVESPVNATPQGPSITISTEAALDHTHPQPSTAVPRTSESNASTAGLRPSSTTTTAPLAVPGHRPSRGLSVSSVNSSAIRSSSRGRSASVSSQSTLHCDACEQAGTGRYHCAPCAVVYCGPCWDNALPHKSTRTRSRGVMHEKIDASLYKKVQDCLYPALSSKQREEAHEADIESTWFGVNPDDPYPTFRDYGRFTDIVSTVRDSSLGQSPTAGSFEDPGHALFPTLTSFVGRTGAGKSTTIKLLIEMGLEDDEHFDTPVVGEQGSHNPTSEDVHLYLGPDSSDSRIQLLADCEGLAGGERAPVGARVKFKRQRKAQEQRAAEGQDKRKRFASERDLVWATDMERRKRQFIVTELYPRILYTFSDVIVFVHRETRSIEEVFELLLRWAKAAIETSSNQPVLPHAVLVFNALDHATTEKSWDPEIATSRIMDSMSGCARNSTFEKYTNFWTSRHKDIRSFKELLESYYGSITVIHIPTGDRPNLLKTQIQRLQKTIKSASEQALEKKRDLRMLLDAVDYESYLNSAFDHFAKNLDAPFDFVDASFARNPIPNNFAGNIVKLVRQIADRWSGRGVHIRQIFDQMSYHIASCIMLDAARNKIKGRTAAIFPRYLNHITDALENFCDQHWPCEYSSGGRKCVNVRAGHSKGHQAKSGEIIAQGEWYSSFTFENHIARFRQDIYENLSELRALVKKHQQDHQDTEIMAAAEIHQKKVLPFFFEYVTARQPRTLTSHSICYCCLVEAPEHPLPCGHIVCTPCLQLYGDAHTTGHTYSMVQCPLERNDPFDNPWKVALKPAHSGVRILTLDGGGIRGIVELEILQRIEMLLGTGLRIKHFFDLIVGTSAGGLITLGLTSCNWTVTKCIENYKNLVQQAFTPRRLVNLKVVGKVVEQYYHSKYRTKPLEDALRKAFGDNTYLFGGKRDVATSIDVKVALTATSSLGYATIFTNYNRICNDKLPYDFQRPENPEHELKTWEIARATSAAPVSFKPYYHPQTKQVFLDGGIYHNNPIHVAHRESKLIWPSLQDEQPDIILSIGSAHGPKKNKKTEARYVSKGIVSNGQFMYKLASDRLHKALESEETWTDFMSVRAPAPSDQGRYQRFSPLMPQSIPKLDDVSAMDSLQDFTKRALDKDPRLERMVRRLVATSFYFEPDAPLPRLGNDHETTGTIVCRFSNAAQDNGGHEVKALSNFITNNRDKDTHFTPHFIVRTLGDEPKVVSVCKLTPSVLEKMARGVITPFRPRIPAKRSSVLTEICLCYSADESYPISGFPRKLHDEHSGITAAERRQALRSSNSPRWTSHSNSARQRNADWTPCHTEATNATSDRIVRYGQAGYVFGDILTSDQAPEVTPMQAFGTTIPPSFSQSRAKLAVTIEENVSQELPAYSLLSPELAGEAAQRVLFHAFARQDWYTTDKTRVWLSLCADDVVAVRAISPLQDTWYGHNLNSHKDGWAPAAILSRASEQPIDRRGLGHLIERSPASASQYTTNRAPSTFSELQGSPVNPFPPELE